MREGRNDKGINAHLISTVMRTAAYQAMVAIRRQRMTFTEYKKAGYDGKPDVYTSADEEAQEIYVRLLRMYFPDYGIIGEENKLRVPCNHPTSNLWFTVDPLDGTKAFMRRMSRGIGTMISLSLDDEVIAACIGDVMTGEFFWYEPGSIVFRTCDERHERLAIDTEKSLKDQNIFLDESPWTYPSYIEACAYPPDRGGLFKKMWIDGGGIGISMTRLWKGEVGGMVLSSGHDTPWDLNPVLGISRQLGFAFLYYNEETNDICFASLLAHKETKKRSHEFLIIHESRVSEFMNWYAKWFSSRKK